MILLFGSLLLFGLGEGFAQTPVVADLVGSVAGPVVPRVFSAASRVHREE